MKMFKYKNQLIIIINVIFWILSISAWNIVFNPGVESTASIQGLPDDALVIMLFDFFIVLILLIPFIWCFKNIRKGLKIAVTILFLVAACYLLFDYFVQEKKNEDFSFITDLFISRFLYVLVFHLTIAAAVYYNIQVLVAKFLRESRFGIYLATISGLIVLAACANFTLFDYVIDKLFPSLYFISYYKIWELMLIVGSYLAFTTVSNFAWQYTAVLIANRDKAQNELSALKAQINPHFLFNNLNTIYSMASRNDEKTKDVILQLSDFLRYVLYDTASEMIPLEKEVDIIRTYVSLQKERVNPEITRIELTTEGNFTGVEIAPLLLLPLAENCFKHGTGSKSGAIKMHIGLKGKQLLFTTDNTISLREKGRENENGGIGISNVEKRLNLLYPERYELHYGEHEGKFRLEMKIEL